MELTYDRPADALYVSVSDAAIARTQQVDDGTLIDLDAADGVVGIEVINPARAWVPLVREACQIDAQVVRRLVEAQSLGVYEVIGADKSASAATNRMLASA